MMGSIKIAEISRENLANFEATAASISDVKHLSSYNWLQASAPTIAVPGSSSLWSPPQASRKVAKDSGLIYIAQNAARHPESPLEPLFRALYISNPSFDIRSVHVVTDRNNVRKLLSFINPALSKDGVEPFTIDIEIKEGTAIFCRAETETFRFVGPHEFIGFGHKFEKAFTTSHIDNSTGHHRIISYMFGGLNFILRYETDRYVARLMKAPIKDARLDNDNLSNMLETLTLNPPGSPVYAASGGSKLMIKEEGQVVPIQSTLEIKTRVFHKPINIQEVLPQMWVSQTPNLVRAYHQNGWFEQPKVEDISSEIRKWEEDHQSDLKKLAALMKKIIKMVKESGGDAVVKYDNQSDKLVIWGADQKKMLPDNLYTRWDKKNSGELELKRSSDQAIESRSPKTAIKIGDVPYEIDLSLIPYLTSFARFQRVAQPQATEFMHNAIPLFDTALKGVELGYRHCFRSLSAELSQYHTLCETYDFLGVDVLGGQSVDDIFVDLRA